MPAFHVHLVGLALLAAMSLPVAPLGAQVTVRCTAETYGTSTYTHCSDGTRSTSERVGSTVYARDNVGRRSTLDANGSTATYRDNRGTRGTIDGVGSTLYYRDNRGTRATLDTYGGAATWRDNRGSRGTYDTYGGSTTYRESRGTRGTITDDGRGVGYAAGDRPRCRGGSGDCRALDAGDRAKAVSGRVRYHSHVTAWWPSSGVRCANRKGGVSAPRAGLGRPS